MSDELYMGSGTLFGTTASFQPGYINQALDLQNTGTDSFFVNDYAQLPNTIIAHDFTVSLWTKFRYNSNATYDCAIYSFGRARLEDSFIIGVDPSGNAHAVIASNFGDAVLDWYQTSSKNIQDDQWHHIAVIFENKLLSFYVDNTLIGSKTLQDIHTPNFNNLCQYLGLHQWKEDSYKRSNFNGQIDQLRIFNAALTAEDISTIYYEELQD